MSAFERSGVWWDPSAPNIQWVGTLSFNPDAGINLTITLPDDSKEPLAGLDTCDVIHGDTSGDGEVSLFRCIKTSTSGPIFGTPRTVRFHADALVTGVLSDSPDPAVSTVSASFRHLTEWWGYSGVSLDTSVAHPGFAPRYEPPPEATIYEHSGIRASLRSIAACSVSTHEASIQEQIVIEVNSDEPRPFSQLEKLLHAFGDFLSIACVDLCDIDELRFLPPAVEGKSRQIARHRAVPHLKNRTPRSSQIQFMLFRYCDFRDRAPQLLRSWFDQMDQLDSARVLYKTGVYGGGYLEHKLLALTQAAEAFHRRYFNDRYMDEQEYQAEVFTPLAAAIPPTVVDSHRQSIAARLRFANELSLRRRLRDLIRVHQNALSVLVQAPELYIDSIVDTRNEFTHFPVPAAESTAYAQKRSPEQILNLNILLQFLMECCFMTAAGFSEDEVVAIAGRSSYYGQLSKRFPR